MQIPLQPFVWFYRKSSNVFQFLEMKQKERVNKRAEQDYYQEEFKREQERTRADEQTRYNEADIREQKKREAEQEAKKKESKKDEY